MLNCKITSSEKTNFYHELQSITLPTKSGQVQILPNHSESFILIEKGDIKLKKVDGQEEVLTVISGQCHVEDDKVVIIL